MEAIRAALVGVKEKKQGSGRGRKERKHSASDDQNQVLSQESWRSELIKGRVVYRPVHSHLACWEPRLANRSKNLLYTRGKENSV